MLMAANKKGLNYYSPIIAIMGIFILGAILSNLFVKQYNLASDFDLGREQFRILLTESSAEKVLLFVDNAARLALEQAAYKYGKNGFYQSGTSCGNKDGFNLWTKEESNTQNDCVPQLTPCYPTNSNMMATLHDFFANALDSFISGFNGKSGLKVEGNKVMLPSSYDFTISPVSGRTEIKGMSQQPVSLAATRTNQLVYDIKPNFRQSITPDVISDGNDVASKSPQLLRKKEQEISSVLSSFNSQNPDLKWELASYLTPPSSCSRVIDKCTYKCNCVIVEYPCPEDNKKICTREDCETCIGSLVETVSYDDVYASFSVANGKGFYISDPSSTPPQLKSVAYNFGLNWLEETGRSTKCEP